MTTGMAPRRRTEASHLLQCGPPPSYVDSRRSMVEAARPRASMALRIDHIGSTAVAGLAAKDVIDIQVTVADLDVARGWPHEILPDLLRRPAVIVDHLPLGLPSDAGE